MANQGSNKNISAQKIIIDGKTGFVVTGMNPKSEIMAGVLLA
jgi:hypothetical protein